MEILSPELRWIGGRCYRVNATNEAAATGGVAAEVAATEADDVAQEVLEQYIEPDLYEDADEKDDYEIVPIANNRFRSTFHVPKTFYGMLIGARGATRKRIETETKTVLKVPQPGADGDVEVMGNSRASVATARRRIDLIVIGARAKQEPTHFVCVPVIGPHIKERFAAFRQTIATGAPVFGLDESMFQSADKLHLTFGMLALMDNWDRKRAERVLLDCQQSIVKPILQAQGGAIQLRMCGAAPMNDDPGEVHVLYAPIDCEPLQRIADQIVTVFVREGLMRREHEHVKLHVTLINSRFRNNSGDYFEEETEAEGGDRKVAAAGSGSVAGSVRRKAFDARQILQQFAAFDFGRQTVSEIHLSRRYTTSCETGFYDASCVLKVF